MNHRPPLPLSLSGIRAYLQLFPTIEVVAGEHLSDSSDSTQIDKKNRRSRVIQEACFSNRHDQLDAKSDFATEN